MSYFCHKSSGIFGYEDGWWLLLRCDKEIVKYYCWLSKRYGRIIEMGSRYGSHISVVKGDTPKDTERWKSLEGESCNFMYSNQIRYEQGYAWLDVQSSELEDIREKLGLTRCPNFSFHLSLGRVS
jgi:hypothetical protein